MRFDNSHWHSEQLKDSFNFLKGNGLAKSDLSIEGKECILYGHLYTTYLSEIIDEVVYKTSSKLKNAMHSNENDVIIPASGETPEDIAKACCIKKAGILLGGDLNILRTTLHDGAFTSYQLNIKRKYQIAKLAVGKTIVHLHNDDLKNLILYFPDSIQKEKKIATFLHLIDKRISTQKKIINSKKSLIKSISQHFFMNAIPNVELKDIVTINKGKQVNGNLLNDTFAYSFFNGGSEASGKYNDYNAENCISISEGGNSCGYVNYVKEKFWSGGHNYILTPIKEINLEYLYTFLKYKEQELMSLRVGTGLPNIQKPSLYKFKIYIPDYNIQNRIALIFTKIRESIENEGKILKLYQQQKDYLLNKMFI